MNESALFHQIQWKQEALLPQRAHRIRRAWLLYFMTFLGKKSVDGIASQVSNDRHSFVVAVAVTVK